MSFQSLDEQDQSFCSCSHCNSSMVRGSVTAANVSNRPAMVEKFREATFTHFLHRKVNKYFLDDLQRIYPDFQFHVKNITEKSRAPRTKDPNRVIIYVDSDNIVVEIPRNG